MNNQNQSLVKKKKVKVDIDGETYEIPYLVFKFFKEQELEVNIAKGIIDNLKYYIYNYTGTNAKA